LALLLSGLSVFASLYWQGRTGVNLWDEGFLWYGVQRVMVGEVPIRDFMAYDPGRYYWSALLMGLLGGNGLMNLRITVAVFQFAGLFVGLLLVLRSTGHKARGSLAFAALAAITLLAWMYPRHKLFDISLSIFLIGILSFLIARPDAKRYFIAGVCVGLVAVFGRNHGVYGAAGSLGVMMWLGIRRAPGERPCRGAALWCLGVAAGFLPIVVLMAIIPGFADAFEQSVRFLFEQKATNLPLPIPWPWTADFSGGLTAAAGQQVVLGLFFVGLLVFGAATLLVVVRQRVQSRKAIPALVAAAFLAIPYAHYAYSRADLGHLAQGIFPLLVGCLVALFLARPWVKWPLAVALCGASLWLLLPVQPGWQCRPAGSCVDVRVNDEVFNVDAWTARDIALLRTLQSRYAPDGTFISSPFWPGAYALLERRSPMWEIYALFPRSRSFEEAEIARIEASKPAFALIQDIALDGRDELRFRNTHPLIYRYIRENFEQVASPVPVYEIYRSKRPAP
jgi:hypothetical protein